MHAVVNISGSRLSVICGLVLFCAVASAQDKPAIKFDYDVKFSTTFDNREYDKSGGLDYSCTLFGLRAQTAVGVSLGKDKPGAVRHRLLAGVDPLYEFGGGWKVQPLVFYEMSTMLRRSRFSIVAGAFPRSRSTEFYSMAFYSDRTKFLDDTYEGLQFSWKGRNFNYELGVDWMGQIRDAAPATREQFQVYSGGHHYFPFGLKLGYSAMLHHYACSMQASNVVDDILVNPYVEMNAGKWLALQSLTARLGYIQAYEYDRQYHGDIYLPGKGELFLEVRKWNVGITNDLFFGGNLMPFYDKLAPEGIAYGQNLYMGDPFMRNAGGKDFGVYDKISVYYEPYIVKKLSLRIQLDFQFNGGYAGCRQFIAVSYQL